MGGVFERVRECRDDDRSSRGIGVCGQEEEEGERVSAKGERAGGAVRLGLG